MPRTTRKSGSDVSTMMRDSSQSVHSNSTSQSHNRQQSRRQSASAQKVLTQEQIAARAKAIWKAKGCQAGQDLENWYEAEKQLKTETRASC